MRKNCSRNIYLHKISTQQNNFNLHHRHLRQTSGPAGSQSSWFFVLRTTVIWPRFLKHDLTWFSTTLFYKKQRCKSLFNFLKYQSIKHSFWVRNSEYNVFNPHFVILQNSSAILSSTRHSGGKVPAKSSSNLTKALLSHENLLSILSNQATWEREWKKIFKMPKNWHGRVILFPWKKDDYLASTSWWRTKENNGFGVLY